jgi:hypothetical protein
MSYGTIKVDTITFTDNSVDKSVSLSGLIQNPTFTGNITVTGTISGDVIRGGTTVSGATVTGTTANFVSGVFTTQISGATVTGTTASFTSGVFTNISGTTATITSGIIASGTAAAPSLAILADLDTGLFSPGANQLAVATNGTGRLFVNSSGQVGINTATPGAGFGINTDVVFGNQLSTGTSCSFRILQTAGTIALQTGQNLTTGSSADLVFGNIYGANEWMRLTAAGRLGIGTSSPGAKLNVSGDVIVNGGGVQFPIQFANAFTPNSQRADLLFTANATSNNALRIGTLASSSGVTLQGTRQSDSGSKVNLVFNPDGGSVGIGTTAPTQLLHLSGASATALVAASSGVGSIQLTRGTTAFQAYASTSACYIGTTSATDFQLRANNSEAARIDTSGRLLVGTSTNSNVSTACFANRSDGAASAWVYLQTTETTPANGNTIGSLVFNSTGNTSINSSAYIICQRDGGTWTNTTSMPGRLVFSVTADGASSPTERMRITSAGNVGIGTTSPSTLLDLSSSTNTYQTIQSTGANNNALTYYKNSAAVSSGFSVGFNADEEAMLWQSENNALRFGTNDTERLRVTAAGLVGIGTSAPGQLVEIKDGSTTTVALRLRTQSANGADGSLIDLSAIGTSGTYGTDFTISNRNTSGGAVTERFRINNQGLVGIGTTSPLSELHIEKATQAHITVKTASSNMAKFGSKGNDVYIAGTAGATNVIFKRNVASTDHPADSGTETARIDSTGNFLVGKSGLGDTDAGLTMRVGGVTAFEATVGAGNGHCMMLNRQSDDGTLIQFRQANSTEGSITVSGSTVSYNGGHLARWSQLPGGVSRTEILRGSVLSNLDEMCEWGEEDNEQLNRMKISDVEGDVNVSGVFQAWDDNDDTYTNDFYCAMTGDFIIRIAEGVTVQRGDLLMSAGDGTAKPQDDDIIRSKTIAKVTSTNVSCTYEDGSYCVPCVLMAC